MEQPSHALIVVAWKMPGWIVRKVELGLLCVSEDRIQFLTTKGITFDTARREANVKWPKFLRGTICWVHTTGTKSRFNFAPPMGAQRPSETWLSQIDTVTSSLNTVLDTHSILSVVDVTGVIRSVPLSSSPIGLGMDILGQLISLKVAIDDHKIAERRGAAVRHFLNRTEPK